MSFWIHFKANFRRLCLQKWRSWFWLEFVVVLLLIGAVIGIRSTLVPLHYDDSNYTKLTTQVPTVEDLFYVPNLTFSGFDKSRSWYLRNWHSFRSLDDIFSDVDNVAFSCESSFGSIPNQDGFLSMCEMSKVAIIPDRTGNVAAKKAAQDFQLFWEEKNPVMIEQKRFEDIDGIVDSASLETYVRSYQRGKGKPPVGLAIVFSSGAPNWEYTLRIPRSSLGRTVNSIATDDIRKGVTIYNNQWLFSGFLTVQTVVDEFIFTHSGVPEGHMTKYSAFRMPTYEYGVDQFWSTNGENLSLFFLLALILPMSNVILGFVRDKESRWRELTYTMGMSQSAYLCSWLVFWSIEFFLIACTMMIFSSLLFTYSNLGLVFLLLLSYSLSVMCFSFLIAAIFTRATIANVVGILFFFGMNNIRIIFKESVGLAQLGGISVFPPVAASLAIETIAEYETNLEGVSYRDPGYGSQLQYSVLFAVLMLLASGVIFLVLGFYFDAVIPLRGGIARKRPLFFLPSCFFLVLEKLRPLSRQIPWVGKADNERQLKSEALEQPQDERDRYSDACSLVKSFELDQANNNKLFENVSDAHQLLRRQGKCVLVNSIEKVFGKGTSREVKAVNGLTTTFFENEISVLLGHNGAGKSTTDSILTGLVPPTSGEVFIYGESIDSNMKSIRKKIGLCPQKNVAIGSLTVKEHLEYMAAIKMIPKEEISSAVRDMIESVALIQKTNTTSQALSGGMKRKLQLAMALIGDNKVCILDEPTSGMDTYARIATQKCLERHRAGRVMVLTTHYMDEADLLGDRVVVMSKGKAQCSGSTLFLKSALGVGYNLVVQTRKCPVVQKKIINEISNWVPESREADNSGSGAEVVFQLPLTSSSQFEPMLRSLEDPQYEVINTSIGVTTLESVFLRLLEGAGVNSDVDEEATQSLFSASGSNNLESIHYAETRLDLDDNQKIIDAEKLNPPGPVSQLSPLLLKRFQTIRRDKRAWCCQIATPLIFLIVGFCLLNLSFTQEDNGYVMNGATDGWNVNQNLSTPIPFNLGAGDSISPNATTSFMERLKMPRIDLSQGVSSAIDTEPFCASNLTIEDRVVASYRSFVRDVRTSVSTPGIELPKDATETSLFLNALILTDPTLCKNNEGAYFTNALDFDLFIRKSRHLAPGSRYAGVLFNSLTNPPTGNVTDITIDVNSTAVYGLPLMVNRLNEAFLHNYNDSVTITTITKTLPYDGESASVFDGLVALLTGMCLSIAFGFVGAGYAVFILREKETGAWHQQLINGVNSWSYIVSNVVFDCLIYFITFIVALILIYSFHVTQFIANISAVLLLLILFGLVMPPFVYCSSNLFSTATTAQLALVFLNLVGAVVLPLTSYVMGLIRALKDVSEQLLFIYRLIPAFCLSHGLINIANIKYFELIFNEEALEAIADGGPKELRNFTGMDLEIAGYDALYLGCEFIFFTIALVVSQFNIRYTRILPNLSFLRWWQKQRDNDEGKTAGAETRLEDDDVLAECERVVDVDVASEAVVVRDLRKVYPNGKVAVKKLSFGIHKNEVFGLLGTNGAGKTTALKIISGEIAPSDGEVFVNGVNVVAKPKEAQKSFGFCPQFDALFDLLTGRESLVFYAQMKGIPAGSIKDVVNGQIDRFGLTPHANRLCGSYSGGNKRKLSVAQATMGAPAVVVLDEPSAGLDIAARHELHKAIAAQSRTSAIVLTTHSMEECEALSDRIAIQVDGRLRCLGSSHHLKTLYGTGFQLEINFRLPCLDRVKQFAELNNMGSFDNRHSSIEDIMKIFEGFGRKAEDLAQNIGFRVVRDQFDHEGFITTETIASWHLLENSFEKAVEILSAKFENVKILERLAGRARIGLPKQNDAQLSTLFGFIESIRDEIDMETYSLGQTTLEQIFNTFAMTQSEKAD